MVNMSTKAGDENESNTLYTVQIDANELEESKWTEQKKRKKPKQNK